MWELDSWKLKKCAQSVEYPDPKALDRVLSQLQSMPPLVSHREVDKLRSQLAAVSRGESFLLQGGDCAELFDYCSEKQIENKIKVLLQMSLIIVWGARVPLVRIARMAGQYAKPRSSAFETVNGTEYPSFRGHNINGMDLSDRTPDPERLVQAYLHSAATINYVRTLLDSGFADLHNTKGWKLQDWDLDHVVSDTLKKEYEQVIRRLDDSLDFMRTIGADTERKLSTVDLFMSHEGLMLDYETCLSRQIGDSFYNLGTHFLWIGDRTRQLDGAHVEYFRGIANPIGVKVGPSMDPNELNRLLDILNPDLKEGKVTLITRYGADKIAKHLPGHIAAVKATPHRVVWCCDPMHGNTETAAGVKTRKFENVVKELVECFNIHKDHGSYLGGVHFELTGDRVTECTGGSMGLLEEHLSTNYQTFCDPRLNYEQSIDVAFLIAKYHEAQRTRP